MGAIKRFSLDPGWPEEAYAVAVFLKIDGKTVVHAMARLVPDLKEAKKEPKHIEKICKENKITIYAVAIMELKLRKKLIHKQEYWEMPSQEMGGWEAMPFWLKALDYPGLFQILAVPEYYGGKKEGWALKIALPFYLTDNDEVVEKYMLTSKTQVDMRAESSALYSIGKVYGMNWKTKEMAEVEKKNEMMN